RQCPNLRTCWPGLGATFNPFTSSSRALTLRRTAFVATLSLRLVHNLLTAFFFSSSDLLSWGLPSALLSVLFFFFLAWNLHLVVDMEGSRTVLGRSWTRDAFDAALWGFVVVHVILLGMDFMAWGVLGGMPGYFIWACTDLTIFLTAWVACWDED
ncbi:hypothetical protein K504DRAFT_354261, partial [Pleomassaria siparia CBS 279.74]